MIISKDEFRTRFATEQGRLGLGYPHVDAGQASAVLANPSMLDATYDGWVQAQQSMPAAPAGAAPSDPASSGPAAEAPSGHGQQPGQYGEQPGPYGQQPGEYGEQPGQYGEQPTQYGQQPGQYGQQEPYGSQYGAPYGQQPGQPYGSPYGQPPQPPTSGNGSYFQQPNGQYGQQPGPQEQPYGMQYRPQAPSPRSALVMAIIGLVAPFVLFGLHVVGTIGLVLGIAALRRSLVLRRMIPVGAPGRGVATTAFVLSILAIVFGGLSFLEFITNLF